MKQTAYRFKIETRRPGTYLRPLTHCHTIEQAVQSAKAHQLELPGGRTAITGTSTGVVSIWEQGCQHSF